MRIKGFIPLLAFVLAICASCAHMEGEPSGLMSTQERLSLAAIYESKGETELALREYEKAARQSGSARAWFAMGNIHLKAGDLDSAESSYLRAVKINPSNGSYHNNLGWVYMQKGEFERAEKAVSEALRLDPDRAFAYLDTLGAVRMKQGDLDGAEAALTEAVAKAPPQDKTGRMEIYSRLAELYRLKGDIDKALRMEQRARETGRER